jgi:type IV secretory pathway TraG/TraD family ATPase VirD4
MREMIRQDIKNGKGVGVIDPHGDLIEDTLANIPKERVDDVVLFEPFDRERPCGLNMLEWETPEQRDFAISEMIMIFNQLFDQSMIGPMFEYYMRNAMAALSADKDDIGTIVEIPRMFTDNAFMEKKVSKVSDHIVRDFWLKEWKQTTGQTRSDMLGYVVSKIGRFVADETMRNIIGQQKSGFDLDKIMSGKKIFLANLSKGLTGELNSSLLGMILVSKMQISALRRARIPEEERVPFYLYVDEFQNFTTDSIAVILSEARKYKLNLILAHQYMPQLKEEIKNAVVGNVGNMISYRVGVDDAEFLERQFKPEFSKLDLQNIDNFQYITKLMINGNISSSFKVAAPFPDPGNKEIAEATRKISKLKYGKPRNLVEQEIKARANL